MMVKIIWLCGTFGILVSSSWTWVVGKQQRRPSKKTQCHVADLLLLQLLPWCRLLDERGLPNNDRIHPIDFEGS